MYVEPNTNIRLLSNIPLDTTYEHTIFFSSAGNQQAFFQGKTKYNLNNYTYQRVQRGWIRVGINAENLYDCNYLMFQNTAFGNKWFYAFITAVEYVNNQCSQVSFEIDVMQTWLLDYSLEYCFVEREHSATDEIGEHIEPESLEVGEYIYNDYSNLSIALGPMAIVVLIADIEQQDGTLYDGIYGGAELTMFNSSDYTSVNALIKSKVDKPESILAIYMCPVIGSGGTIPSGGIKIEYSSAATSIVGSSDAIKGVEGIDGYVPKNRKLYTYPYNFFSIDNANGQSLNLRYEFFNNFQPTWRISVPITPPIQCLLRPTNYKGASQLNSESISLSNYPLCSWVNDSFSTWIAQNAIPMSINTLTGIAAGALGGPVIGAVSLLQTATNTMTQFYQASIKADVSRGTINNGSGNVSAGTQSFFGGRCSITAEYARCIDDFFTTFGYATRRNKIPNRNVRPHWTYCKTIGCNIVGSIPADDARKICEIYDHGITWWLNGNEVGDYSLDNRV